MNGESWNDPVRSLAGVKVVKEKRHPVRLFQGSVDPFCLDKMFIYRVYKDHMAVAVHSSQTVSRHGSEFSDPDDPEGKHVRH
jgi:hypothetical protein